MVLMLAVAALTLFASGVACRLLDPDRDWPQADTLARHAPTQDLSTPAH